ncbi:MAG: hypothetical protein K5663_00195 [Clostridiales bacterium]|nr:hypothetical protein [Clostridiales bacterium]
MRADLSGRRPGAALLSGAAIMRNYADTPFPVKMSQAQKADMEDRVSSALCAAFPGIVTGKTPDTKDEPRYLSEMALDTVFFAEHNKAYGTRLMLDTRHPILATVNRREHLLLTSAAPGGDIYRAYSLIKPLEKAFAGGGEPAFDSNWGYLTARSGYCGNAFFGCCLMNLKGIWQLERNKDLIKTLMGQGFSLRPLFQRESCNLHVLSNKHQLGETPQDIIAELESKASELSEMETDSLEELIYDDVDSFADEVARALGVMLNARLMNYRELLNLYSVLRAGLLTGFMEGDCAELDEFIVSMSPRAVREKLGAQDEREEELTRAEKVRDHISSEIKTNTF